MTIHDALLHKARAAGKALADAESRVQSARGEYHALVRRMHLAGGSLREIAHALGLSHQRVQQMVDGAGGSWWRRVWRSRNARRDLVCTFCGRTEIEVAQLIAGPKVFICDSCIATAERIAAGEAASVSHGGLARAAARARARCSFCWARQGAGRPLLTSPAGNICRECLTVCSQILLDSAP